LSRKGAVQAEYLNNAAGQQVVRRQTIHSVFNFHELVKSTGFQPVSFSLKRR